MDVQKQPPAWIKAALGWDGNFTKYYLRISDESSNFTQNYVIARIDEVFKDKKFEERLAIGNAAIIASQMAFRQLCLPGDLEPQLSGGVPMQEKLEVLERNKDIFPMVSNEYEKLLNLLGKEEYMNVMTKMAEIIEKSIDAYKAHCETQSRTR